MAAYGALISLSQTLETILNLPHDRSRISLDSHNLESLREKVSSFLQYLENPSRKTGDQKDLDVLETKIRDAAFMAEDLIESRVSKIFVPRHIIKQIVPNPEIRQPAAVTVEAETERRQGQISLGSFLFFAFKGFIMFVLVQNMSHFAVKMFLPVEFQSMVFLVVQILMAVAIIVYSARFLVQNETRLPSVEVKSRRFKEEKPLTVQYVEYNSDLEELDLHQLIEEVGLIMGRVVKEVGSIMNEVIKTKDPYGSEDLRPAKNLLHSTLSSTGDSSVTGKNFVVGLDGDLEEMRARLTGDSDNLEVVPIVGMGGIGKTTLARQVYDDNYIGHHFDIRAWVTVSQEYSLRQVLVNLLDSAKMFTEKMYEKREDQLAEYLYKCLKDRRYLVVIDDMWDREIWDAVRRSFPLDNNGSRVLVTTRLSEVALYANSCCPLHRMRFLTQDQSWNLLCHKVFGDKECPLGLRQIGRGIAGSCEGLPLAIAVIGGLLSKGSRTKEYWRSVADNLVSIVTKNDDQCMEILSLSYNHLPHRLRPCFLYMGVFPEDYEIPVLKLTRLWAAEGFLEPRGSKSVEEVAEECLRDLVERNLVLVCKKSANGKIKTCNIHDLLRNLCMRNAQKENFLYVVKCEDDVLLQPINTRRSSIHPNFLSTQSEILHNSKIRYSSPHSLLCTGARLIYPSRVYLGYKLLRVLDLVIVRFFHFPDEIVKLVNLRYLAFTYNEALPPSISQLRNLETLVHHNWTYRQCPFIPLEIWLMPKLRHLCVTPSFLRDPIHAQILVNSSFLLENLQTLLEVRNLRCGNDVLKRIPNLKELEVSYDVPPSIVWSEYQLEALVDLPQLETLKLVIKNSDHRSQIVNPPKLAFPIHLKRLTLSGCCIPWSNMTVIGALPNLEVLKLRSNACRGSEWEPVEEEFCRLKYLLLEELDIVQWSADETHFPRLQHLIIRSCYKLREIPSAFGEITTLETIELVDCHSSVVTSVKKIEEKQQNLGNEDLKVHVDMRRRFKNKFYSRVLH